MTFARRTVAGVVALEGRGLHGGEPVRVAIHPAEDGIHFRSGAERVPARPESVTATDRSTRLGPVGTVEHLMSAFAGLGVTDAEVEVHGPELPGLDGSAAPYLAAIGAAGLAVLGPWEPRLPFSRVFLQDGDVRIAIARGEGQWRYDYDLGDRWPGMQSAEFLASAGSYADEIAPARTFALIEEVPMILDRGLGKGLEPDAALVIGKESYKSEPRFPDEPARHKLLDLIGDLYLAGIPIAALNVVASRSGHRTHVAAAARLLQATAP